MNKHCESLKEHAIEIINFEKKDNMSLTNKELQRYASQGNYHIFKKITLMIKNIVKLDIGKYRGAADNICNVYLMKITKDWTMNIILFHKKARRII